MYEYINQRNLSMVVIDSGCTKTACGQVWLDCCETSFRCGNGKVFKSIKPVTLRTFIANKNILLTKEVIENDIPLLRSKDAVKKAETYINFSKDKIIILDEEVPVKFSTSEHYCIAVRKMNKK